MQATDILARIIELIKEYPNDAELGNKIRDLYWKYKEKLNDED